MRMSSLPNSTVGRRMAYEKPNSLQRCFQPRLAAKIFERRIFGGIGDADMDDAFDAGLAGGFEQDQRILARRTACLKKR